MYLQVTKLTEFLIDNCPQLFGEDALALYGDSDEDELSDNQGNAYALEFRLPIHFNVDEVSTVSDVP